MAPETHSSEHNDVDLDALETSLGEADPALAPAIAEEIAAALDTSLDASGTETPTERHS
ncbi:MAG: hypothetical protein O3B42_01280 [Actinomycetota bacterium]|nr:hypothetical protein [Actinomycetota bacterium]